ncbi:unnamed protein product [Pleuronectes platessa]|uniref:Ig-like domain-containing protein n=1 Tax=Pleuronectes platessa TaxID=8262 RepID=A0A9N7YYD4_PLEPL|nr:unnamed protein product [Pleuronectes platessa]
MRHVIHPSTGAATTPYVKIRNVTGDGVLLECLVPGAHPEPQVEWQTSDGIVVPAEEPQVSPRGHRFDVLLLTTVKKTNMYRCVVKQEGFGHVIHNELLVPDNLFEDKSPLYQCAHGCDITLIVALVIALLVIAILVIIIMNQRKKAKQKGSSTEVLPLNGHRLSNGS